MITRTLAADVIGAEMNDEYGIDITTPQGVTALTVGEALDLVDELNDAINAAQYAAEQDARRPRPGFEFDQEPVTDHTGPNLIVLDGNAAARAIDLASKRHHGGDDGGSAA